ncbi:MAG: creatininase family protein, partial [Syntrophomonas sp.]
VSLAKWGFNQLIIISGHAEPKNGEAMREGIRKASKKNEQINGMISDWFGKGLPQLGTICNGAHPEWDFHSGEIETSFMLLKYPELVEMEALSKLEPNWEGEHLFENIAAGKDSFADMGAPLAYFGDPRVSTKETGEKLQDFFSDIIVEEVLELLK